MAQNCSLILRRKKTIPVFSFKETLSLFLPGIPLCIGTWGMLGKIGSFSPLLYIILSLITIAAVLFLSRKQHGSLIVMLFVGITALLCLIMHSPLSRSLSAFLNEPSAWLTRRTGIYHLPFLSDGSAFLFLLFLSVLIGLALGSLLRCRNPLWLIVLLPVLLPEATGVLHGGWYLALYMVGTILLAIKFSSGTGRSLLCATLTITVAGCFICGACFAADPISERTAVGEAVARTLHRYCWEKSPNPMPEGDLRKLPPFAPSRDKALEVTMDHWTPLYIRGYIGSVYTGQRWDPVSPEDAAANAASLYALQKESFFPSTQSGAAWEALDIKSKNTVTIQIHGACRARTYAPYAISQPHDFDPNPRQLTGEGMNFPHSDILTADLWDVNDSYLLQEKLSHAEVTHYRQAESVYRQWIHDTCLSVPKSAYDTLRSLVKLPKTDLTTTRAREEVLRITNQLLTYEEGTLTDAGNRDFLSYVLTNNPKGYSVHYATLSALLMRCCGIPARYVEGYVITPAMAETLKDGESLTVQQLHSHAWCEFYLDGVGWIPFDTSPGYHDILSYPLPPDGTPTEGNSSEETLHLNQSPQTPKEKPLQIDQEKEKNGQSHWIFVREAISILLLLILFILVLVVIRTAVLRHRLHVRKEGFSDSDPRLGTGRMLAYASELLALLGLANNNQPLFHRREEIASLLKNEDQLDEILSLYQELWFSNHLITEAHRRQARFWLDTIEHIWYSRTPRMKRFIQRWLCGRVI